MTCNFPATSELLNLSTTEHDPGAHGHGLSRLRPDARTYFWLRTFFGPSRYHLTEARPPLLASRNSIFHAPHVSTIQMAAREHSKRIAPSCQRRPPSTRCIESTAAQPPNPPWSPSLPPCFRYGPKRSLLYTCKIGLCVRNSMKCSIGARGSVFRLIRCGLRFRLQPVSAPGAAARRTKGPTPERGLHWGNADGYL